MTVVYWLMICIFLGLVVTIKYDFDPYWYKKKEKFSNYTALILYSIIIAFATLGFFVFPMSK
jgi:hypothetical protein